MKTHGQGSIVKLENKEKRRCRKWQLRVSVGKNPYSGKYETKTRVIHGTYTEANNALSDFKAELQNLSHSNPLNKNTPFKTYAKNYCELRAEGRTGVNASTISQGTVKKDKWNFNAVAREIGADTPIGSITPKMLEQMFIDMRSGNGATKKKLSGTYTSTIYVALNGLFTYAVKNGDLERNPLENVEQPKVDTAKKRALPRNKMLVFIRALDASDRMQFGVKMIVCCGLRRSELAYSKISGINLEEEYIRVEKSKTKAGLRIIPLSEDSLEAVKTRLKKLNEEMNYYGVEINEDTPLLANGIGEGVTPHYIGVWWQKHREEYGLEGWTLHELRHSFISLLGASRVPMKDIQELAGHENAQTTLDIYSHTNLEEKREAINSAYKYLHANSSMDE